MGLVDSDSDIKESFKIKDLGENVLELKIFCVSDEVCLKFASEWEELTFIKGLENKGLAYSNAFYTNSHIRLLDGYPTLIGYILYRS